MSSQRTVAAVLLAVALLCQSGCGESSLDSPEYGEIIQRVPPHLDQPYPLPELEPPATTPAPGPQSSGDPAAVSEPATK
jgi:hypothetical protein